LSGKTLKYDFVNVNLPPIDQKPNTIGFVSFSVPVKKSTPVGTWIRNRATVRFYKAGTILQTNVVENCVGADFTVSAPCFGAATQFTTLDDAGNSYLPSWADSLTIRWNFGDGSSTNRQRNVSHVYTRPGAYTATLTFADIARRRMWLCDQYDSVFTITKLVTVDSVPATLYTRNGDALTAVSAAAYRWSLGDSLLADTRSFVPTDTGAYKLCITTAGGCEACTTVTVTGNRDSANFIANRLCFGDTALFTTRFSTNSSTLPSWADSTSIQWKFGDGDTASGLHVEHKYRRVDTYTVTLTFKTLQGKRHWLGTTYDSVFTITKLVTVDSVPAILYTRNGDTLTALSAAAYRWLLGDSLLAVTRSFVPTDAGTYKLCITTAGGCDTCTTFVYTSASLPTERALPALAIHPNPGSDLFVVELGQAATTAGQCVVINALGAVVRRTAIEPGSSTATLDMRGFPSGAYLARIAFGATVTTLGFVVQR
jgi:hypothetical protein